MFERETSLDGIAVLGHQLNPTRSVSMIKSQKLGITAESAINAAAAGILYNAGFVKELVLPTGPTLGADYISEAELIDNELTRYFVPSSARILRPFSKDTAGDARVSIETFNERGHKKVGVLSIEKHAEHAADLFKYYGLTIPKKYILPSEKIVYLHMRESDPRKAEEFIRDFRYFSVLSGIDLREFVRGILLSTIDPGGKLLGEITKKTRG